MTSSESSETSARPPSPNERIKAPLAGIIVGVVLVAGLGAWTVKRMGEANASQAELAERRAEDSKRATAAANAPLSVEVVMATSASWLARAELTGTLEASQSARLAFKVPGLLRTINGKVGDVVRAGQVLATLDSSETRAQLAVTEAQIKASEAQLALAVDAERRTASLVKAGSIAEAQGVQTEQQKALAAAQLEAAKAQAALIRVTLGNQVLTAPFAGTLTAAPKGIGAVVNPGEALFELTNTTTLTLASTVSERDADLIAPGSVITLSTPSGEVQGSVRSVLAALDGPTRRVPVRADFANPGNLRAGAFVRGWVTSQREVPVVRLPHSVLRPGAQDELFVVGPGDTLELRSVAFAIDTDGTLLVRHGVSASDRVVVSPHPEAQPGDRVQVKQDGKGAP